MIDDILPLLKKVKQHGNYYTACCPAHDDRQASLSVKMGDKGILLNCHAGCTFEAITDALGIKPSDLFLESEKPVRSFARPKPAPADVFEPAPEQRETDIYQYRDESGSVLYEVVRYEPKTFRQRHVRNGVTIWNMTGVRRVPYNLPNVMRSEVVHITEGEKDADILECLGYTATTNVGGAAKWLDAYAEFFTGKRVVVWPDRDAAGEKHLEVVLKSLSNTAKDIRVCRVPHGKDVHDFISANLDNAAERVDGLMAEAEVLTKGVHVPVYTMAEASEHYARFIQQHAEVTFEMRKFLPSFRDMRPLVPGELVVVMADTGHGKSAALQNIAQAAKPLPVLYFSLELPMTMVFERQITVAYGIKGYDIEAAYRGNRRTETTEADHILICEKSRLKPQDIERIINQTELKIGQRPAIVMVDYLGLVQGDSKRYERLSDAAEDLKRIAKDTNTIVFMASQLKRRDDNTEVFLHDGKDSGSIENSGGLVLGLWRNASDGTGKTMMIKVLKYTKGKAGQIVTCDFDGEKMQIRERLNERSSLPF